MASVLAGGRGWNGPAWFLEHRFPRRWAPRRVDEDAEQRSGAGILDIFWSILHDGDLELSDEQAETLSRPFREGIHRLATDLGLDDQIPDVPLEQDELP